MPRRHRYMSAFMHFIKQNFLTYYHLPAGVQNFATRWYHQGISFILMSVFGPNNVILSTAKPGPSNTRSIYLSIDYQYQWNLTTIRFLFGFGNGLGWTDPLPAPKYPLMCNKPFDVFTKNLHSKENESFDRENSCTWDNFSDILKQALCIFHCDNKICAFSIQKRKVI